MIVLVPATAAMVVRTPNPVYALAGSAASLPRGELAAVHTPNPMHQSADGGNGGSGGGVANNDGIANTANKHLPQPPLLVRVLRLLEACRLTLLTKAIVYAVPVG